MTKLDSHRVFLDSHVHIPSRTLYFTGDPEDAHELFIKGLHILESLSIDPIHVKLHSFGGDWYAGIGIYDAIRSSTAPVNIEVVGCAMSMASVILQAATTRCMTAHSTLMLHDGQESFEGKPQDMEIWAKHSKSVCNQMYKIYAERSHKTAAYWRKRCKHDHVVTADEALKLGLIDKITTSA